MYDVNINKASGLLNVCGWSFLSVLPAISCNVGELSINIITDSCNDSATVIVNNGTPPYSYHWSNGQTTNNLTGISPGIYSVTVSDNSCVMKIGIDTITLNPALQLSITPNNPIICPGDTITLNVSCNLAGTNFIWSNGCLLYTSDAADE